MKYLIAGAAALAIAGCQSMYYGALEQVGIEKRDVLVDRVDDGRDAQADAQKVFRNALERYRSVVAVDGGNLEKKYNKLAASHKRMESESKAVRGRIQDIRDVGKALFREWEAELGQYSNPSLRAQSKEQYELTLARYKTVLGAMDRAAERMDPVLAIYGDQVLFLKHNLNARAVAALEVERANIETRVETLLLEMDLAIAEASEFIAEMRS